LQYEQNQNQLKVDVKLNQGGSDGGSDGGGDRIKQTYEASSITRVVAYLLGADDNFQGGSDGGSVGGADLSMSQFVFGGAGKDKIHGGRGNNVLVGGSGDDNIQGGSGRDILIGGLGEDTLEGKAGDDILIGGTTANQDYLNVLDQALADWATGDLNATLFSLGNLIDDHEEDDLFGDQGTDYLYGGVGDKLKQ
jgi:Ca2+-binding RTX toxin-like protein